MLVGSHSYGCWECNTYDGGMLFSSQHPVRLLVLVIGVALAVIGIVLPMILSDERPVPLNLTTTTVALHDPHATVGRNYRSDGARQAVTAPVTRQFKITLGEPASQTEAHARVGVATHRTDVDNDLDSLLDAQVFNFQVNRLSGQAVDSTAQVADTPIIPSSEVAMQGYWVKFPDNTQKHSYDYFDVTLRHTIAARFAREETRKTAEGEDAVVYVFRQDIAAESVKEQYEGVRNEITDPQTGQKAQLYHGGWREIAVEPRTGMIVGVEEEIHDAYRQGDVEKEVLLDFHGVSSEELNQELLTQAVSLGTTRGLRIWRVALTASGVIVASVSLAVIVRTRLRRWHRRA